MTTPSERIQGLVQRGALPAEDAKALLAAVGAPRRARGAALLLDPLECLGAAPLTLIGLGAALLGVGLERSGLAFDGFLDLHITQQPWRWTTSLGHALAAWPLGALVLWLASLLAGRQGRLVDFLGLVGIARLPSVLLAIPSVLILGAAGLTPGRMPAQLPSVLVITALALAGVAWLLVIAYRGFGTASGLRGAKRVVAFVAGVLIAEVASKLVFVWLVRLAALSGAV